MTNGNFATLLRGLCIDLTGTPCAVVTGDGESIPAGAMKAAVPPEAGEDKAAEIIRGAYAAWKAENSSAAKPGKVLLPSCAALYASDAVRTFWIACDLDSARKKHAEKDSSPVIADIAEKGALVLPAERARVMKNRIALVTGGAQGIGEEIVRNLAGAGALVYIADLNLEGAKKLATGINAAEGRTATLALEANVSDEASVEAMFNAVAETSGGLDLCVSNAGVLKAGSVLEQEFAEFKFVTDINYSGFFVVSKHAGRLLRLQHRSAPHWKTDIVQINSKSGLEGSNKNGAYAGGKFGGLGLVASFAMELVEYNIKVNAICPGNFLDGPLWSHPEKGLFVQYLKTGKVPGAKTVADVRSYYEARVPMKRGCTGKDLARALFYIVEQEYETGQAVPVTGGQVMLH